MPVFTPETFGTDMFERDSPFLSAINSSVNTNHITPVFVPKSCKTHSTTGHLLNSKQSLSYSELSRTPPPPSDMNPCSIDAVSGLKRTRPCTDFIPLGFGQSEPFCITTGLIPVSLSLSSNISPSLFNAKFTAEKVSLDSLLKFACDSSHSFSFSHPSQETLRYHKSGLRRHFGVSSTHQDKFSRSEASERCMKSRTNYPHTDFCGTLDLQHPSISFPSLCPTLSQYTPLSSLSAQIIPNYNVFEKHFSTPSAATDTSTCSSNFPTSNARSSPSLVTSSRYSDEAYNSKPNFLLQLPSDVRRTSLPMAKSSTDLSLQNSKFSYQSLSLPYHQNHYHSPVSSFNEHSGSRPLPIAQSIFATTLHAPWNITAANDLACFAFGVTRSELQKLDILDVVHESRRSWLCDKLTKSNIKNATSCENSVKSFSDSASSFSDLPSPSEHSTCSSGSKHSSPSSPRLAWERVCSTFGAGITEMLPQTPGKLTQDFERHDICRTSDSQLNYSIDSQKLDEEYDNPLKSCTSDHPAQNVLLRGEIVPIRKRNGMLVSVSLWVKENVDCLIWVLEEVNEDVLLVSVDKTWQVTRSWSGPSDFWTIGQNSLISMKLSRPAEFEEYTHHNANLEPSLSSTCEESEYYHTVKLGDRHIPVTVEKLKNGYDCLPRTYQGKACTKGLNNAESIDNSNDVDEIILRISSLPYASGIIIVDGESYEALCGNSAFSAVLFGRNEVKGLSIGEILPEFKRLIEVIKRENMADLTAESVVSECIFRRAQALLEVQNGITCRNRDRDRDIEKLRNHDLWYTMVSSAYKPAIIKAKHRNGGIIMVDVQMRVMNYPLYHEEANQNKIGKKFGGDEREGCEGKMIYVLWISYSRKHHMGLQSTIDPSRQYNASIDMRSFPGPEMNRGESVGGGEDSSISNENRDNWVRDRFGRVLRVCRREIENGQTSENLRNEESRRAEDEITRLSNDESNIGTGTGKQHKKTITDFEVLGEMGQGAYGQVKLCRNLHTKKKVIMKYVTKRRILVDTWTRDRRLGTVPLEIHVLDYLRREKLGHPNIIEMMDFFEDEINYYIEMVPHGVTGMDLFDYIEVTNNMEESECQRIFTQVASAVHHLHTKAQIVHRDIKDENVILDGEGRIKLIDFGSAAYVKNGPFGVFVGTIDYAAPEVLAGHVYRGKEQDVWALGILLYTIIYKENPFYSIDEIMDHGLRVPHVMSESSLSLIRCMLNRDVEGRITITEVLNHPWCKEFIDRANNRPDQRVNSHNSTQLSRY